MAAAGKYAITCQLTRPSSLRHRPTPLLRRRRPRRHHPRRRRRPRRHRPRRRRRLRRRHPRLRRGCRRRRLCRCQHCRSRQSHHCSRQSHRRRRRCSPSPRHCRLNSRHCRCPPRGSCRPGRRRHCPPRGSCRPGRPGRHRPGCPAPRTCRQQVPNSIPWQRLSLTQCTTRTAEGDDSASHSQSARFTRGRLGRRTEGAPVFVFVFAWPVGAGEPDCDRAQARQRDGGPADTNAALPAHT